MEPLKEPQQDEGFIYSTTEFKVTLSGGGDAEVLRDKLLSSLNKAMIDMVKDPELTHVGMMITSKPTSYTIIGGE